MMHQTVAPTPADLRAAQARALVPTFLIAGRVRVHPARLGAMLRGRVPMPGELAVEVARAIDELGTAARSAGAVAP